MKATTTLFAVLGSAVFTYAQSTTQSCTSTIIQNIVPAEQQNCTFIASTVTNTQTSYTDCGGCALTTSTNILGIGIACETVTTAPGTKTTTVTDIVCAPSPTCTSTVDQLIAINIGPTSFMFNATATSTAFTDCSGCALVTQEIGGDGPVAEFTATVTSPVTTTTVLACSKTAVS